MTSTLPPPPPAVTQPWYKKTWVIAVAALLVGVGIGGASGGSSKEDPKTSDAYKTLSSKLSSETAAREKAETDLTAIAGDVPAREAAVTKAEQGLKSREVAVSAQEKSVRKREKAVGIVEADIAANTVSGEGIYKVGSDMKPGTYKTSGSSGCYYAVLRSTDTSDIVDNNNIDGPGFATVNRGQYFETSGCADWVLQR